MRRLFLLIMMMVAVSVAGHAQEGLNVGGYFSDDYARLPGVTMVSMLYDPVEKSGIRIYKSISVEGEPSLADKIRRDVMKDGVSAVSKEVSYKKGDLYFGFYSMGGKGHGKRYLLYLNRRHAGEEKTTLIFIEGSLSESAVKGILKKRK